MNYKEQHLFVLKYIDFQDYYKQIKIMLIELVILNRVQLFEQIEKQHFQH